MSKLPTILWFEAGRSDMVFWGPQECAHCERVVTKYGCAQIPGTPEAYFFCSVKCAEAKTVLHALEDAARS